MSHQINFLDVRCIENKIRHLRDVTLLDGQMRKKREWVDTSERDSRYDEDSGRAYYIYLPAFYVVRFESIRDKVSMYLCHTYIHTYIHTWVRIDFFPVVIGFPPCDKPPFSRRNSRLCPTIPQSLRGAHRVCEMLPTAFGKR